MAAEGLICGNFGDLLMGEGERLLALLGKGDRAIMLLLADEGPARGVKSKAPCDISETDLAGEVARVELKGFVADVGLVGGEFIELALEVAD